MSARDTAATHSVTNQPPARTGFNAWLTDPLARTAANAIGAGWIEERAAALGEFVGSERLQQLAGQANRCAPELKTHDRFGHRVDAVEFHPAYHELMREAFGAGLHALAWTAPQSGFAARAALNYLWNQGEFGVACPVTMTFAGIALMRRAPELAREWEPKLLAFDYDPRPLPVAAKRAVTVGMALTEKQGGSDLRAITTTAQDAGDGWHALTGHKWFCSAPMADGFFTLARLGSDGAITCFFVPRTLPDGERNALRIQRLKDKVGNRSNASAEIEYAGTLARRVGDEGRGIATLIEMAHYTRYDIVIACAGMMRAAVAEALHHVRHRTAFGRVLAEQPLMENVIADLALEWEAAMLTAFRLAQGFDRARNDDRERALARLLTPVAKYRLCKRLPAVAVEAMECAGGNGYVEESPLARLYREAPVHGIWEGSGNVVALDTLRALAKEPQVFDAFFDEIAPAAAAEPRLARHVERLRGEMRGNRDRIEGAGRRITEGCALALQGALMVCHAAPAAADAFCASRLDGGAGYSFGALAAADTGAILARITGD